jgi:hypothetical protein
MGLYVKFEEVRLRLIGKVRFTDNENDENRMYIPLANRLINEAEGEVEMDLSPRYHAPFQTDDGKPFDQLPSRPTKELLKTICEAMSVIRILETDFGKGSVADADKYASALRKRYDVNIKKLLERKKSNTENLDMSGWRYPPLPGLKLNYNNIMADDGFAGKPMITGGKYAGEFAADQINNPATSFWTPNWDSLWE